MFLLLALASLVHIVFESADFEDEVQVVRPDSPPSEPSTSSISAAGSVFNGAGPSHPFLSIPDDDELPPSKHSLHAEPTERVEPVAFAKPQKKKSGGRKTEKANLCRNSSRNPLPMVSHTRFVNESARRYYDQVSTRMVVSEHEYPILDFSLELVTSLGLGWVQNVCRHYNLRNLLSGPPNSFKFNLTVVREFFANFPKLNAFSYDVEVVVHGRVI